MMMRIDEQVLGYADDEEASQRAWVGALDDCNRADRDWASLRVDVLPYPAELRGVKSTINSGLATVYHCARGDFDTASNRLFWYKWFRDGLHDSLAEHGIQFP